MTKRRCRRTSPARLPDNDDVLAEILLRLPPQPSSLPRAGLVCKRWRRLVTDPYFIRRFRARHQTPPLLGFFRSTCRFFRTLEVQDPLPASHFSLQRWRGQIRSPCWHLLDCRHGLVLYGFYGRTRIREFVVADPMTGHRRRILNTNTEHDGVVAAAVVSAVAGDIVRRSFRLVVLFASNFEERVSASVYSTDSCVWAHSVAALVLPFPSYSIYTPCLLSGHAIYWLHDNGVIIRFDLESRSLAMIEQPPAADVRRVLTRQLVSLGSGQFGFAFLSESKIQLWEREEEPSSPAKWALRKTVQLDKVLPLNLKEHVMVLGIAGFAEESNVIFACTCDGVFTIHLESMRFKKLYGKPVFQNILPYSSF